MSKHKSSLLREMTTALACGAAMLVLSVGMTRGQAPDKAKTPPPAKDTKPTDAKDTKEQAKDSNQDARDRVKDSAKDDRDAGRNAKDDTRGPAKDTRDTAKDTRDTAKDAPAKDTRDTAKDAPRDKSDTARDADKGARDRDPRRDADRETRRDGDQDARRRGRPERAPDLGLWFSRAAKGLEIADIASKGAITKLGFHEGDVIVSVNGHRVNREAEFMDYLFADNGPNERVKVIVLRSGREETILVEPTVFVEEYSYVDNDPLESFGLVLDDRTADRVVVWRVLPQTPAYYSGIRAGDVIVSFNGKRVAAMRDFGRLVQDTTPGAIAIEVSRNNKTRKIDAELAQYQPRSERTTTFRQDLDRRDDRRDNREERRDDRRDSRDDPKSTEKPAAPPAAVPTPTIPAPTPVVPTPPTTPTNPRVPLLPPRR